MLVKILSNVSYDSKVLLEGEIHEVDEKFANDFISRKIAKLEKEDVTEKPKKGKKEKSEEKIEDEKDLDEKSDLENNLDQD